MAPRERICGTAAKRSRVRCAAAESRSATVRCTWLPLMEHFMRLVFRWSINAGMRLALVLNFLAAAAWAQLPEGPGREETIRLCSRCHELDRSYSVRQDREGWQATMTKM